MPKTQHSLHALGHSTISYPSCYDAQLIERIERKLRRKNFNAPMYGIDIWRAYEISFLLPSGLPQYMVIEITIPAHSIYLPESKSLKLYFNSFNQSIFKDTHFVVQTIQQDLSTVLEGNVMVQIIDKDDFKQYENWYENYLLRDAICLDKISTTIVGYTYDAHLLQKEKRNTFHHTIRLYSDLLRSNCEITNQPDWGRVFIEYTPDKEFLLRESLLQYIVSYRTHQEFHEPTCERIYNDIYQCIKPSYLLVICQYTRRGGIDINPIRTNHFNSLQSILLPKLLQQ
ncbi:MAG: hypothetical protein ACRCR9_04560 [Chitinophagaceae bacterium]